MTKLLAPSLSKKFSETTLQILQEFYLALGIVIKTRFCYEMNLSVWIWDHFWWLQGSLEFINFLKFVFLGILKGTIVINLDRKIIKVGLSRSKKVFFIYFHDSPLKMIKNAFYFILKALFVLKIFKFLSWHFGHVEKTAWLEG